MAIAFRTTIFLLVFVVGGIALQIFLSRRESKWPGLVLPGLTFLYSLLMLLSVAVYDGGFPWGPILASLVGGNIPTVILLAIYFACREKFRKRSEMEKFRSHQVVLQNTTHLGTANYDVNRLAQRKVRMV